MHERIVLYRRSVPTEGGLDSDLEWMCCALGLCGAKDHDRTCMRVFRRVIVTSRAGSGVSSSELGEELGLSRTSIVHHLNRLLESGVVERRKSRYFLRSNNLHRTLMELERDIERMFESMQEVADALDRELELPERRLLREEEEG